MRRNTSSSLRFPLVTYVTVRSRQEIRFNEKQNKIKKC